MQIETRLSVATITLLLIAGCTYHPVGQSAHQVARQVTEAAAGMTPGEDVITTEIGSLTVHNHKNKHVYTAGKITEDKTFPALKAAGFEQVINLQTPTEMSGNDEATKVTAAGMEYFSFPVNGTADLTRENIKKLHDILKKGHKKTLLHCASSNRAGAAMALIMAWEHNVPVAEAIKIGEVYGLKGLKPAVEKILQQ